MSGRPSLQEHLSADFERLSVQRSTVTVVSEVTPSLLAAFAGKSTIAFDSEGISLSRTGKICVVQLGTQGHTFILDVLDKPRTDPLVQWLKGVMEDGGIVKIVHDCRMDSEALWHQKGIKLVNVHDTSCWHSAITGQHVNRTSLTYALRFYGLPCGSRDNSIYTTNPAFWAQRPMTQKMVERAAGDIDMLIKMRDKQLERATSSQAQRAARDSEFDSSETWKPQHQSAGAAAAAADDAFYYDDQLDDFAVYGHLFENYQDFSNFVDDNDWAIEKYGFENIVSSMREFGD